MLQCGWRGAFLKADHVPPLRGTIHWSLWMTSRLCVKVCKVLMPPCPLLLFFYVCPTPYTSPGPSSQSYGFSSSHVWMWELDHKKSRVPKNWCFWTVVLEKTLESPLDCMEVKPVHPKGNQSWLFFGRIDAEAEASILWPSDAKNWLIGRLWCWEGLGARGEGNDRGWDGWMASPTRWTWVWVNSGFWW